MQIEKQSHTRRQDAARERELNYYLLVVLGDIDGVDLLVRGDHEKGSLSNLTKTKTYKPRKKHVYLRLCL